MVKLAYTGLSHYRQISVKELHAAGLSKDVEGVEKIDLIRDEHEPRHNPGNKLKNWAEVPQEVADLLMAAEPDDWKLLKDDEDAASDLGDSAPSGDGSGESSSSTGSSDASGAIVDASGIGQTASAKSARARG